MPKRTTKERGYSGLHAAERERWRPIVEAGEAVCSEPVCLKPTRWINPTEPWDLSHADTRDTYLGPSHRSCNRSEGSRRWHTLRRARRQPRRWAL